MKFWIFNCFCILSLCFGQDCDSALSNCQSECSTEVYDYDKSEYVSNDEFISKCEDSCENGYSECEDAQNFEKCDEFRSNCNSYCPSSLYDDNTGDYLNTDASSRCEDACSAGESSC